MVKILIPKERRAGETRVAATPETVKRLIKDGFDLWIEAGAGEDSFLPDQAYEEAGGKIASDGVAAWSDADVVLKVGPLTTDEIEALKPEAIVIGLLDPHRETEMVRKLASSRITSLAMELVPRITRAQSMDALSSQANIAGYKAVVLAASRLSRYFPLLMTAAGTIPPARVVIMGAGVAGLQAVATAKRLGAIVEVSDIRPAVKEQVESLGGRFIDLPFEESGEGTGGYAKEMGEDFLRRQREILTEHVGAADVVITTAQVPGKQAPRLLTLDMVNAMRPGAVVVDLAAEQGGNCEISRAGEEVVHNGVLILGPVNLAASMSHDASMVYARNVLALLQGMAKDETIQIDLEDEVVAGSLLTHAGEIAHAPTAEKLRGEQP